MNDPSSVPIVPGAVSAPLPAEPASPAPSPNRVALKWTAFIIGPIALILIPVAIFFPQVLNRDTGPAQPSAYGAEVACRSFVRDHLKAPSTAEFSGVAVKTSGQPPLFTVTGAVDSQNSFGAMIRSRWSCAVRPDGHNWRLESISVG